MRRNNGIDRGFLRQQAERVRQGLRVVSAEYTREVDIIMAWRRDSMGEAKAWCLREIPKLLAKRNQA
ncbi:hypothetical protein CRX72_05135 [Pantoea sp. BRM17]|nr:hypothetical protein CRX72_05135 [Pantoea sp. BRM17]